MASRRGADCPLRITQVVLPSSRVTQFHPLVPHLLVLGAGPGLFQSIFNGGEGMWASGSVGRWLGSGFSMREKVKVLSGSLAVGSYVSAPISIKIIIMLFPVLSPAEDRAFLLVVPSSVVNLNMVWLSPRLMWSYCNVIRTMSSIFDGLGHHCPLCFLNSPCFKRLLCLSMIPLLLFSNIIL